MTKHCRLCNARLRPEQDWLDNYCCIDHRDEFQARQQESTIERLRREEPNESELAMHAFEPKRVRLSMLSGTDPGRGGGIITHAGAGEASAWATPRVVNPPQLYSQPLVAPPLQPKATVEQSLAALSFVAEPVSEPLQIPDGYLGASSAVWDAMPEVPEFLPAERLGAAVGKRRIADRVLAPPDAQPEIAAAQEDSLPESMALLQSIADAEPSPVKTRNQAIVNLIKNAQAASVEVALGVPTPARRQNPPEPDEPSPQPKRPISNNRVGAPPRAAQPASLKPRPAARVVTKRPQPADGPFSSLFNSDGFMEVRESFWKRRGLALAAVVLALSAGGAFLLIAPGGQGKGNSLVSAASLAPGIGGDWKTETASGGREYELFEPSAQMADFQVTFDGQVRKRALNWVFRRRDAKNYYAAKIVEREQGRASFVRWRVENGQAGAPVTVAISQGENGINQVQMQAKGFHFTTMVNGRKVDEFNDSTFASGKFGFVNMPDEHGAHGPVRFAALK